MALLSAIIAVVKEKKVLGEELGGRGEFATCFLKLIPYFIPICSIFYTILSTREHNHTVSPHAVIVS